MRVGNGFAALGVMQVRFGDQVINRGRLEQAMQGLNLYTFTHPRSGELYYIYRCMGEHDQGYFQVTVRGAKFDFWINPDGKITGNPNRQTPYSSESVVIRPEHMNFLENLIQ